MLAVLRLRMLLLAAVLMAVQGCEDVSVVEVDVASVSVTPGEATLLPDEATQLSATPRDPSGAVLSNRTVTWRSDNSAVASVDGSGRVKAHAEGTSRIEASVGGVVGAALIIVVPAPRIELSRTSVEFAGVAGGNATSPEEILVQNQGGGSLAGISIQIDYASGQPGGWLDAVLQGSTAPTTLTLRALPGALAEGTYQAQVRVIASAADNSPRVIGVTFQVQAAAPVIRVDPEALGFSTSEGQGAPPAQNVTVTNAGGGSLTGLSAAVTYPTGSQSGWLAASLDRTTAPATLLLTVNPSGLATGVFDATVQVTSPSAPGGGASVQVRLRFGDPPPQIDVSPASVQITMEEGAPAPGLTAVQVGNAGTGHLGGLSAQVQYSGSASGWLQASLRSPVAPTVLDLQFNSKDLVPGTYAAQVNLASPDAINSPVAVGVQLVVRARPSVETSTLTAAPDTIVADGVSTSAITVTLNDPRGQPIPTGGDSVQVFTTAGTLSDVSSLGNGRYRATLVSSKVAETATVTARLRGVAIQDSARVHFRSAGPDAGQSTVSATPTTVAPGVPSVITVQLRNADGTLVTTSGDDVFLTTDLGTLTPPGGTSVTGVFTSSFSSAVAGTATITAYLGTNASSPQIGTATVTVTAGSPDAGQSTVEASPTSVAPDAKSTITVQLRDAAGNPIGTSGSNIFLTTDLGLLDPKSGTTTNGVFTAMFSSATTGTATIRAYLGTNASSPHIGTATVTVTAVDDNGGPDAGQSTVAAIPDTVASGVPSVVTVQLRNADGSLVTASGDDVFLATDLGTLTPQGGTTVAGVFTSAFSSITTGTATISAYLGSDADAPQIGTAIVTVIAGTPDPGQSALDAGSENPQVDPDGSLTVRVQLRDADGNDVTTSGDPIFLTTDLGELDPVRGTTTEGSFESVFTSSETGTATIAAYLGEDEGGQSIGTLSVKIEERTADPGTSEVTSDRTHMPRNGSANIRVQLRDSAGNPLTSSGTPVFLTSSRGQMSPPGGTTTNGVFESVFTSSQPGNTVITAYLGENAQGPRIGTVEVVVQGAGGEETAVLTADTLIMTTDESLTLRIEVRDANGNLVTTSGTEVSLVASMGMLDPAAGVTTNGVFVSQFTSTSAGTALVTAYLGDPDAGQLINELQIVVEPGALSAEGSTIIASPSEVDPGEPATLTVQLRDAAGNAVPLEGQGIVLATTGGELSATSGTTDGNGRWTATLLLAEASEAATVTAYLVDDDAWIPIGSVIVTLSSNAAVASRSGS